MYRHWGNVPPPPVLHWLELLGSLHLPQHFETYVQIQVSVFYINVNCTYPVGWTSDITRVAATCGEDALSTYVTPNQGPSSMASQVTGITLKDWNLFPNGHLVDSVGSHQAMTAFVESLSKFNKPALDCPNVTKCYTNVLYNWLKQHNMWSHFITLIFGFKPPTLLPSLV